MSGEKIQLDEWDLSDPLDRYLLAFHMSQSHAKRVQVAFLGILAGSSVVSHVLTGLYFQSDPLFYLFYLTIHFDIARILAVIGTVALFCILWYAWVRYDAPSEEHIRSLYSAAEHWEDIHDADGEDAP